MEFRTGQAKGSSMQDAFDSLSISMREITDITLAVRGKSSAAYIKKIQPQLKPYHCICIIVKDPIWRGVITKKQIFSNKGTRKWEKWYVVYKEDGGLIDKQKMQGDAIKSAEAYTLKYGIATYVDYEDQKVEGVKTVCKVIGTRPENPVEQGNYWFMWTE